MGNSYQTLILETEESGIYTLTINRPDQLNALNNQVFVDIDAALDVIEADSLARALIITGAGEKSFVAGADIKEFSDYGSAQATEMAQRGHRVFQRIEDMPIPVVAAVNGYALGGGLELAMACHLRVLSQEAVVGLPEVGLGLIPGYGGTQRLTDLVGRAKALEMIMSGGYFKADEALQIGLANKIAETSAYEDAKAMIAPMLKKAPIAIKNAILAVKSAGKNDGYQTEAKLFGELFDTADFKEGTTAFLEKRKPNFSGK